MAGLDPAAQDRGLDACLIELEWNVLMGLVSTLGGRVKPGHDDLIDVWLTARI